MGELFTGTKGVGRMGVGTTVLLLLFVPLVSLVPLVPLLLLVLESSVN